MNTARRAAEIQPFEVMDVLSRAHALERAGRHVVHMEIGEPDFTAPEPVVEAGVRALREGRTAYTATLGLPALREAIAVHYASKFRASVPVERVVITSGASGGLLTVAALYFDAGDEVLVPDPGYPGYRHFVRAFEGRARALPVGPAENFQPTLAMRRGSARVRPARCTPAGIAQAGGLPASRGIRGSRPHRKRRRGGMDSQPPRTSPNSAGAGGGSARRTIRPGRRRSRDTAAAPPLRSGRCSQPRS